MATRALRIRSATIADAPGIWEVRHAVTENTLTPGTISDEQLRRALEDVGQGWVAEERRCILGFAIGLASGNLWALFVRPEAQGRGVGSLLHARALEWFVQQPVSQLWLSTGTATRARRFYESRGWCCAGPSAIDEVRLERPNGSEKPR